jgi:hypothetical protein
MGALAILGALSAFTVGARTGAAINGQTSSMTVARIPMPTLTVAINR